MIIGFIQILLILVLLTIVSRKKPHKIIDIQAKMILQQNVTLATNKVVAESLTRIIVMQNAYVNKLQEDRHTMNTRLDEITAMLPTSSVPDESHALVTVYQKMDEVKRLIADYNPELMTQVEQILGQTQ